MRKEKTVSYQSTNTYSTLNQFTSKTQNVWVVFHGIGYLSRYFLKYFRHLDPEKNYVVAPQAPSKYYLNGKYEHIGASWATREETEMEMENVMAYLDSLYEAEDLQNAPNLILFGYSQGVSVVTRWIARRKITCAQLILNSGKIPSELKPGDFLHLARTPISYLYGTQDPFLSQDILRNEEKRLKDLFPRNLKIIPFAGGHKVNSEFLQELA